MITARNARIAALSAAAALLLAIFTFSAGAEKKTLPGKRPGVLTVHEVQALLQLPENRQAAVTVRGLYAGTAPGIIFIKSNVAGNEKEQLVTCRVASPDAAGLAGVPLNSELVLTGHAVIENNSFQIDQCQLITVNIADTTVSY